MEYSPGRIFKDPSLPELEPHQRTEVYSAMNSVLCQIHSVGIQTVGLEDYGKHSRSSASRLLPCRNSRLWGYVKIKWDPLMERELQVGAGIFLEERALQVMREKS